jgi:hypothetical protein
MKFVLYAMLVVIGVALIGVSVSILKSVDAELGLQAVKPREVVGQATQRGAAVAPTRISEVSAQRLTLLGSVTGVLGAFNMMIGSFLIVVTLLETKSRRSRLGTDMKPDA